MKNIRFLHGLKALSAMLLTASFLIPAQPFFTPIVNSSVQLQAAIPGISVKLKLVDVRRDSDGRSYKRYEYQLCIWGVCQDQGYGIDVFDDGEVREWSSASSNSAPKQNPIVDTLPEGHELRIFADRAKFISDEIGESVINSLITKGSKLDILEQTDGNIRFRSDINGKMSFFNLLTGDEIATINVTANAEYTLPIANVANGGYILAINPTSATDKAAFKKIIITR